MRKSENIVSYTMDEIKDMIARGDYMSDWDRVDALSEEELEASIDKEEEGEIDWSTIQAGFPKPKRQLTVRFDGDIIDWFKAQGAGYQTRMNAVLRSYVDAQKRRGAASSRRG